MELDRHFATGDQAVTVLVPSYAEQPEVVRATLWSAALQEFPDVQVVLLIDDKPFPTDPATLALLERTRGLPLEIEAALQEPLAVIAPYWACVSGELGVRAPTALTAASLADLYARCAGWLSGMAGRENVIDHADAFFVDQVLLSLARDLAGVADGLRRRDPTDPPSLAECRTLVQRVRRIFSARLVVFERKRYASLSHEANKAMNLNSYISLMGHEWVIEALSDTDRPLTTLRPARPGERPDLAVPATDYLLTLDADSLLVPDYCLRLVHVLEQPGQERIAVIQTPYSSYRGAPTTVERIAGMTTDLQHLQHQGRTAFDATFWVGANAVIRSAALADIVEVGVEDGPAGRHEVRTYIQDRTVIEDTESSMDLVARGWSLHNHPERLSYSATPPDFGSLVVQRRRWANGGLIIMPKIVDVLRGRRARGERTRLGEIVVRLDYLGSIAWTTCGLVLLLAIPASNELLSPLLALTAMPYFAAMATDLRTSGHRAGNVLWVFALNLVLVPVNLAGVLKSIEQAVTKRKIPFARTPKVADRVAAPALYVLLPYLLALILLALAVISGLRGHWMGMVFGTVIGVAMLVGAMAFVGTRAAVEDVAAGWRSRWSGEGTRSTHARGHRSRPISAAALRREHWRRYPPTHRRPSVQGVLNRV
ncbi:glycosyltransferase family 2 protein [Granulicoccus sp. GXG6511]|uniref:glycosyltransferase family 2 protein n=1 Tax=Granulicoccus sp. GXG6511 TaxID=3381351 RepID=UPI003D7D8BDE